MTDHDDFAVKTHALLDTYGDLMLSLAKASIVYTLDHGEPAGVNLETLPVPLHDIGGCFVTLRTHAQLRGCIGSPEAWRPLATDVVGNANRAAFHDPRFGPLQSEETQALDVHISVLSPSQPFAFADQADFFAKLRSGTDGLVIEDLGKRALFLPSVWDQLPDPQKFVAHLKIKAGLTQDHWSDTFKAWRFIASGCGAKWADIAPLP